MEREELDKGWERLAMLVYEVAPEVRYDSPTWTELLWKLLAAERASADERIRLLEHAVDTQREIIEQLRGQVKG